MPGLLTALATEAGGALSHCGGNVAPYCEESGKVTLGCSWRLCIAQVWDLDPRGLAV